MARQAALLDMRFVVDCIKTDGGGLRDAVLIDGSYLSPSHRAMPSGSMIWSLEDEKAWDEYTDTLDDYLDALNDQLAGGIHREDGMLIFTAPDPETFWKPLTGDEATLFLLWSSRRLYPCNCVNSGKNCTVEG